MSLEVINQANLILVKYSIKHELMNQDHIKTIFEDIKKIEISRLKDFKWMVFDFGQTKSIHVNTIPMLCRISSYLEQYELKFAVVGESKICDLITKNGIERMVLPYTNLDLFNKAQGFQTKDNVKIFLNTLLESVISSMKILIETDVTIKKVDLIKDIALIPTIQAGAMAGILSAHFSGNIVIGFNSDVFKKVMSVFLQMEIAEITPEIKDGAAELLNVIIGQTKIKLNENGFEIRQVIPNVITGDKILISPMAKQSSILISCESGVGDFIILLSTNAS